MKLQSPILVFLSDNNGFSTVNGFWFMFFISRNTIAVNMNLADQANLAALLRSLGYRDKKGGKKIKRHKRRKTCCLFQGDRGLELLPLQRPASLKPVLSWFSLLAAALPSGCRVHNLQFLVCIAYNFTFLISGFAFSFLLLLSIFSWDNQTQCSSLWPRLLRPLRIAQWQGKLAAFQHRDPQPDTVTASGTSLFNKRLEAASSAFVCLSMHYEWEVLRKTGFCPSHDHSLCVCWNASAFLSLLTWGSSFFALYVCQRDCQMTVRMGIYWQWPWYFELALYSYVM